MSKLFKNSKQIMAVVIAFAILAVSLFAGSIVAGAETGGSSSHCEGRIEYWEGNRDSTLSGEGTKTNPYMITNAAELNYVCTGANQATENKYYVVDPTIRAFILQPQATVTALGGDSVFMDIASAEETKELFEVTAAGKNIVSWVKDGEGVFAGYFDGNGVEIYGLYSDGTNVVSTQQASALFPKVDGNGADVDKGAATDKPTVLTRFAVKNSYFKGFRRVAAVAGTSWWKSDSGTNCDGWIELSYCEVANNFLVGQNRLESDNTLQSFNSGEMAVVCGAPDQDPFKASYLSVYGNATEYRSYASGTSTTYTVDSTKDFNRVFSSNQKNEAGMYGELHNSISLDTKVTGLMGNNDITTYVSDVYTNLTSTVGGVTVLENDGYGVEGQAAMNKLDWENTWFMSHNGPTFRDLHGEMGTLVQDDRTHGYGCLDCGLVDANGYIGHSYECTDEVNKIYVCSECEHQCTHYYWDEEVYDGDCIKAPGTYISCACGFYEEYPLDEAPGHTLQYVAADAGDCETEGHLAYWYCSVCDKNFAESDYETEELAKWAAMDTAVTDTELNTGFGAHIKDTDENGQIVVMYDENGHWYICSVNGGRLDHNSNALAEDKVVKHSFNKSVCIDCGYECKDHNWKSTGKVIVMGDCYTDHEVEYKCTVCNAPKTVVTKQKGHDIVAVAEVAATDKLEGTKAHYLCNTCKSIFADAEGKTSLTKASLVIPKVFSAEQQAIIDANTQVNVNTDNSSKSPATGDSLVSVLAVAALSGAAFVIARKAMKA